MASDVAVDDSLRPHEDKMYDESDQYVKIQVAMDEDVIQVDNEYTHKLLLTKCATEVHSVLTSLKISSLKEQMH